MKAYAATDEPLVTLGMPVFNGEQTLREALDSLVFQLYKNIEILIIDNNSSDGTEDVCREYSARDSRVRYERNPTNVGVAANFTRLIGRARGELFMWVAADDVRPLDAVALMVEAFRRNAALVMVHGPIIIEQCGLSSPALVSNAMDTVGPSAARRVGELACGLRHNAMVYGMYRRAVMPGGLLFVGPGADYVLCLLMCSLGPVERTAGPVLIYREKPGVNFDEPMYKLVELRNLDLFNIGRGRRHKCWTVLLRGGYHVLRLPGLGLWAKLSAVAAHSFRFGHRYRLHLAQELMFQSLWLVKRAARVPRKLIAMGRPSPIQTDVQRN